MCNENLAIYSGNDDQILPILSLGGLGVISVLSNIIPKDVNKIIREFFDGNINVAKKLQLQAIPLIKALFSETNPLPIKYALSLIGYDVGIPRLPLIEMSQTGKEVLKKELEMYFSNHNSSVK